MINREWTKQPGVRETEERCDLSSAGRGEWRAEGVGLDECFNPGNESHLQMLRGWCLAHWTTTFRRSMLYGNSLTYHRCCNSFSRRAFVKAAGHPADESFTVRQVPRLRNGSSAEDLFTWLLEEALEHQRRGRKMLFPSLNRVHANADQTLEAELQAKSEEGALARRMSELLQETERQNKKLKELEKENTRLLSSSMSWHSKYKELLDQTKPPEWLFDTPMKATLKYDEEEFPKD